jgi:DNA adenine methylase
VNVERPVVRWHGGKWLLAPWIIEHFPRTRFYVEPFGGGGSVLMRKPGLTPKSGTTWTAMW